MSSRKSFGGMFGKKASEQSLNQGSNQAQVTTSKNASKPVRAVALDNFKSIQLPKTFAEDILENDILFETQEKPDVVIAQKLIQLYMLGVEYYSSQQDQVRMNYFQNKLNLLMMSPKFFDTQIQTKQQEIEQMTKRAADEDKIKEAVNSLQDNKKKIDSLIHQEIQGQEDHLKKRLQDRRTRSSQRFVPGRALLPKPEQKAVVLMERQGLQLERQQTREQLDKDNQKLQERLHRFEKSGKRGSLKYEQLFPLQRAKVSQKSLSAP